MIGWIQLTLAVLIAVILFVLTAALLLRRYFFRQSTARVDGVPSLCDGITKIRPTFVQTKMGLNHQIDLSSRRRPGYSVFGRMTSARPLFNWADHPSLITDAVENGWSGFAFLGYKSCLSSRASLLGDCASGDPHWRGVTAPDISWEVNHGSSDFMQKIRLNLGLKRINLSNPLAAACVIKAALPLPGPPLGNSSFPQEAYFEITILGSGSDHGSKGSVGEGERTKLIRADSELKAKSFVHVASDQGNNRVEELKLNVKDESLDVPVLLSVGLTAGGALSLKLPGTYAGSIGFNLNGSIYLDGSKVVLESKKTEWGRTEKVIGCGFDPRQKKVFFTADSELVKVVHCKAEEYGAPLYPTLAANYDITVTVNFGQGPFKYSPANMHRTSNPCFISPPTNSTATAAALAYDDSRELFSMERIDSGWLHRSVNRGSYRSHQQNSRTVNFDEESEADLFEIVLDGAGQPAARVS